MNSNLSKEYAQILKLYLAKFGLEPGDIAFFLKSRKGVVEGLLNSKNEIVLTTLEAISQIFGLRYYQFGDPKFPMPHLNDLPEETKARIKYRKEKGPSITITYNSRDLKEKIHFILSEYNIHDEFLPSEIGKKVNKKFQLELPNFKQITDRFKKDFQEFIEKTGESKKIKGKKGRREEYYRLIKKVPKVKK